MGRLALGERHRTLDSPPLAGGPGGVRGEQDTRHLALVTRHLPLLPLLLLSLPVYATDLPATIAADTTLTAAQSPYYLQSNVTIAAGVTVTVAVGVEILAAGDYRLYVNGALLGAGTASQPIVIGAVASASRGAWQGLYVAATGSLDLTYAYLKNGVCNVTSPGGRIRLDHCNVRLASADGLYAWGPTVLDCDFTTFSSNTGRGVYLEGYQATGTIAACTFESNGSYPAQLKATLLEILGSGNEFRGNAIQRLGVSCSMADDITDTDTWTRQRVPFELGAGGGDQVLRIAAGGRLNIAGGNTIYATRLDCYGRLDAWGSSSLHSVFTSPAASPAPGDWEGIVFYAGSTGNLRDAQLRYATTAVTADDAHLWLAGTVIERCQFDGARVTGNSQATVRDAVFRDNGGDGLQLSAPGLTGSVRSSRFLGNGAYPVRALASNLTCLQTNNLHQGNALQMIGVDCDLTPDLSSGDHVWVNQGVPLDLAAAPGGSVLNIGASAGLTINAGQTIYCGGIDVSGRLTVNACSANPCVFLPAGGGTVAGSWTGLRYLGGTGALVGAVVRYATNGVFLSDASPRVRECVFSDSQFDGMRCHGISAPVIVGSRFLDNGRYGLYLANTAQPNLGDLTNAVTDDNGRNVLSGNGTYEVYNDTAGDIRAQNNTWSSDDEGMVAARIFDQADLSTRGCVFYHPLYSVPENHAPVLAWAGTTGYGRDGVDPEVAGPAVVFHFRLRYLDPDDDAPADLRLHLARDGAEIAGSPFAMTLQGDPTYAAGALFAHDLTLPAGRDYRCWFSASDGGLPATGVPTYPQSRPIVTTQPTLTFAGQPGYQTDGVNPDSGSAGTNFTFRCKYTDADDDEPLRVLCHLLRAGTPTAGSPFAMTALNANAPSVGRVYQVRRTLNQSGAYSVRFEATDGIRQATGPAAESTPGPTVSPSAPALLALTAAEIGGGVVRVQWHMAGPAVVDLQVCNLAGRIVAQICRNREIGAGPASALWRRRLSSGAAAPAGPYMLVLQAQSDDGRRQRATRLLLLR